MNKRPTAIRRRRAVKAIVSATGGYALTRIWRPASALATYSEGALGASTKLSGRIRYGGTPPSPLIRPVTSDFEIAGKEPRVWEGINVGKDHGLVDAIVVVNGVFSGKPFSPTAPLAYVEGARILTRTDVFGWKEELKLRLENKDPIVHSWIVRNGEDTVGHVGHPPGAILQFAVSSAGLYELNCAPHPWERGFRMAVPHPYFAKTDANGAFEIAELPRGDYTVDIWAEGLQPKRLWLAAFASSVSIEQTFGPDDLNRALRASR